MKAYLVKYVNDYIEIDNVNRLTIGRYYIAFDKTNFNFTQSIDLIDNEGRFDWYYKDRFEIVK